MIGEHFLAKILSIKPYQKRGTFYGRSIRSVNGCNSETAPIHNQMWSDVQCKNLSLSSDRHLPYLKNEVATYGVLHCVIAVRHLKRPNTD